MEKLDDEVRMMLLRHHIHYQPASKARLYLPRSESGRGLHSIVHKSELILLQLYDALKSDGSTSSRRAAILHVEKTSKSDLALIREYLAARYKLPDATKITRKLIIESQRTSLYSEISTKTLQQKLYNTLIQK